ncbi:MAG: FKBP-type peptidyl-prolyl cis-trans isomerase [Saprospiraceae bacterium]|nr:FKBP-type peptidyl-prolyl cis-trans isomerase [Saprospiraceae bacterium]
MKYFLSALVVALALPAAAQQMSNELDSVSYSAGIIVAKNLKVQGLDVMNAELFLLGVLQVLNEEQTAMSPSEAEQYFRNFQAEKRRLEGMMNKQLGEQFLAENAKREGVFTTESGLQYEVIKMGDGPKPKATDKVYTHYHGTLMDGTVFDSSVERNEPIEFGLNQVITGWTEVLQLMPVGSKFRAFSPYQLAYGERGAGGVIEPYSMLIFEIELLEIR